jgi:hypothetical protein
VDFGSGRHAEPNANGDCNEYCYSDCYCDSDGYSHSDSHSHIAASIADAERAAGDAYRNTDGHGYSYALADVNPTTYASAKVYPSTGNSANSGAAPVALTIDGGTRCPQRVGSCGLAA